MTKTSCRQNLLICLSLTAAILAVYWPIGHFMFINYDDPQYLTENLHVQSGLTLREIGWAFATHHEANWHPLTWLSHMLDWQLWGNKAGGHHLVNVFFHVSNTLLLFCILGRITGAPWRSAFVAALFALHPLHVESVAWASERKDVLSTCFWMLTLWGYVRYVEQPYPQRYLITLGFYTLSLMSKPMGVTLPFVLLLLDYWPLGRTRWAEPATGQRIKVRPNQLIKEKLPLFVLAIMSCVTTYWAQHSGGAVASLERLPLSMRIGNALLSYVAYMGKTLWPTGLAVFYPLNRNLSLAAAVIAGIALAWATAMVIWKARRAPWLATGWFWYLGTLVPVIGLVQVGNQSMADRYTYVPAIGLFLMLCWSVPWWAADRRNFRIFSCIAAGAVLAVCMVLSRIQVGYWRDNETLFLHALNVTHDNWLAHYSLGVALRLSGKPEEAVAHFEQALRIKPRFDNAHYHLGSILWQTGKREEAIWHLEQALQIRPDFAEAHNNLGSALLQLDKPQEAAEHFRQAVQLKPDYVVAQNNLGGALLQLDKPQEAVEHFTRALQLKPDYVAAHFNLGLALEQVGRTNEAIDHYEQVLRLKPDFADAQNRLARLRAAH